MRFGIDLGGTKIEILALDSHNQEVFRKRIETPKGDYQKTLQAICSLVDIAEANLGVKGSVGIGIPGSLSRKTGLVKNANSTWLIGEDLKGDLQQALNREVRLANDANCFALSEASDGAAEGAESVFGVIIGTGCGGGLVFNQQIMEGINSIGGEWGHNPLPWQDPDDSPQDCYCGLKGCNETYLSGSGFERHFCLQTGKNLSSQKIVELASLGDSDAQQHLNKYYQWLAKGLASVINIVDPDVIVLGGGMSNIQSLYSEVPKIWQQWIFSDQVETKLRPPKWGDSSGVRGAAWLWPNSY